MTKDSNRFYADLSGVSTFVKVFQKYDHQPLPADWSVIVTDIVNSTTAIAEGKYKDVNIAGGLTAMAVSNACGGMDFPFVFGGDGMTCLLPPAHFPMIRDVLFDMKEKVWDFFQLELRVGIIEVEELYRRGLSLEISKLRVSPHYDQAILHGDAVAFAENLIKSPEGKSYLVNEKRNPAVEADFTGFTCRWKHIPSQQGETISTIITLRDTRGQGVDELLTRILRKRSQIFGKEEKYHPISSRRLKLTGSVSDLKKEAIVYSGQKSGWNYLFYLLVFRIQLLITRLALTFKLPIKVNWYNLARLKTYQIASSDFQKYDGSLKMVIDSSPSAREEWIRYLQKLFEEKKIFFGVHVADRAVLTCMLHQGSSREVHFIDAAGGGYTLAAKQLKSQMLTEG